MIPVIEDTILCLPLVIVNLSIFHGNILFCYLPATHFCQFIHVRCVRLHKPSTNFAFKGQDIQRFANLSKCLENLK